MFDVRNLSVLAYANGFTLWHYKTPGALAPVQAPGFFDGAADMLASGDMLLVSAPEGGRVLCAGVSEGRVVAAPMA
jgi:hypothetical protein